MLLRNTRRGSAEPGPDPGLREAASHRGQQAARHSPAPANKPAGRLAGRSPKNPWERVSCGSATWWLLEGRSHARAEFVPMSPVRQEASRTTSRSRSGHSSPLPGVPYPPMACADSNLHAGSSLMIMPATLAGSLGFRSFQAVAEVRTVVAFNLLRTEPNLRQGVCRATASPYCISPDGAIGSNRADRARQGE